MKRGLEDFGSRNIGAGAPQMKDLGGTKLHGGTKLIQRREDFLFKILAAKNCF